MAESRPWQKADKLRQLYLDQDLTQEEIGERLGCTRRTVRSWIHEFGISRREDKPWKSETVLRSLREEGLSQAEIAAELDVCQATISNWMRKFDIDTSRIQEEKAWHNADLLQKLYVENEMTIEQVAEELGCDWQTVQDWLYRHDIDTRSRNPQPPRELRHGEALRVLYRENGLSTYTIAELAGCAPSAVYSWLERHGIETRAVGSQPGELHHRWKGGGDPYYGRNWTERRRQVLERDDHECQRCGISDSKHRTQHDRGLDVHHRVPLREFEEPELANRLSNLVTFCRECHIKADADTTYE